MKIFGKEMTPKIEKILFELTNFPKQIAAIYYNKKSNLDEKMIRLLELLSTFFFEEQDNNDSGFYTFFKEILKVQ